MNERDNQTGMMENNVKSVKQPSLHYICEEFQGEVNRYDGFICELANKLQSIERIEEPTTLNEEDEMREPDSAVDNIKFLLEKLNQYNHKMEACLRHLNQII